MTVTITTTSWDVTKIRARAGQAYLMAYPTAAPSDVTTPHAILKSYFENFYVDGDKKTQLITGLKPWAYVDAKGFILDPKYKSLDFKQAVGLDINAGKFLESCNGELNIGDVSVAKFTELLSATANEAISISTSSTAYSSVTKKGVLIGTQPFNLRYIMMYRFPSVDVNGAIIPGEFDHILIPRLTLSVDPKLEFTQTKAQDIKVTVKAESDLYLYSPDSGLAVAAYFEETTAAVPTT